MEANRITGRGAPDRRVRLQGVQQRGCIRSGSKVGGDRFRRYPRRRTCSIRSKSQGIGTNEAQTPASRRSDSTRRRRDRSRLRRPSGAEGVERSTGDGMAIDGRCSSIGRRGHATVGIHDRSSLDRLLSLRACGGRVMEFDPEAAKPCSTMRATRTLTATAYARCPEGAAAAVPLLRPERRELYSNGQRVHQRVVRRHRDSDSSQGADRHKLTDVIYEVNTICFTGDGSPTPIPTSSSR